MSKTVLQRRVPEMPYLTKAQVEYLHNAWNKSSGIDRLQQTLTRVQTDLEATSNQLEQAEQQLGEAQSTITGLTSANQTLSSVNSQQAIEILSLREQLTTAEGNQMPNHFVTLLQDITLYSNCIVFMSFTPNITTFNVASISGQSGTTYIEYPGNGCPYICIIRTAPDGEQYNVLFGHIGGATTQQISGSSLSINYSADNQNILLLNHTD